MGARNVASAFALWSDLDHGPFRLLVGMALVALDAPTKEGRPARVYFGGEAGLVDLYGRGGKSVYNALAALRAAGAVEVLEKGRNGHRAVYKLNLDPFADGPEASRVVTRGRQGAEPEGSRHVTPKGHVSVREGSRERPRRVTQTRPLGTTKESTRKSPQGETSPEEVTHQSATSRNANTGDLDYDTASKIVQAAIGIEAATARIRDLAADGTNYATAMVTLAQQIEDEKAVKR